METVERHEPWTNHVHMRFIFYFFARLKYTANRMEHTKTYTQTETRISINKMHFVKQMKNCLLLQSQIWIFAILFSTIMFHSAVIVFLFLCFHSVFCFVYLFLLVLSFVECVYVSVIAITLLAFHRYVAFGTLILNHKNKRRKANEWTKNHVYLYSIHYIIIK